jgi:hypothetical protein
MEYEKKIALTQRSVGRHPQGAVRGWGEVRIGSGADLDRRTAVHSIHDLRQPTAVEGRYP